MYTNLAMKRSLSSAPVSLSVGGRSRAASVRRLAAAPRASATLSQTSELQQIAKALQEARSLPPSQRPEALQAAGKVVKQNLNALRQSESTMLWNSYEGRAKRRTVRISNLEDMPVQLFHYYAPAANCPGLVVGRAPV